jgi:DNA-binding HxlR family transcriptional regulator
MTLREPLAAIREWAETNVNEIVRARLAFDAERTQDLEHDPG